MVGKNVSWVTLSVISSFSVHNGTLKRFEIKLTVELEVLGIFCSLYPQIFADS